MTLLLITYKGDLLPIPNYLVPLYRQLRQTSPLSARARLYPCYVRRFGHARLNSNCCFLLVISLKGGSKRNWAISDRKPSFPVRIEVLLDWWGVLRCWINTINYSSFFSIRKKGYNLILLVVSSNFHVASQKISIPSVLGLTSGDQAVWGPLGTYCLLTEINPAALLILIGIFLCQ